MTMRTWRGTVLFTGTLATIAVAAGAKFAGADATAIQSTGGTGTTTQSGTGTAAKSVSFQRMIHRIHTGEEMT